jgi:hypothetical protein
MTFLQLPPVHFLDATAPEELSVPSRISLVFSCPNPKTGAPPTPLLLSSWLNASVDFNVVYLRSLIKVSIIWLPAYEHV